MSEEKVAICDDCGERKICRMRCDPYEFEINDVEIERCLCEDCYQERADAI